MDEDELDFDFEQDLQTQQSAATAAHAGPGGLVRLSCLMHEEGGPGGPPPHIPPGANIGQSLGNLKKNYRQTVCTYWLKGLCMKGDTCGFLHVFDVSRMPVCRQLLKYGVCKEADCPYKHSLEEIKECNMYKLGFCVYGPQCRYRHTRLPTPPPEPESIEAAKPREFRDPNKVVNFANPGILGDTNGRLGGGGRFGGGRGRGMGGRAGGREGPMPLAGPGFQAPPPLQYQPGPAGLLPGPRPPPGAPPGVPQGGQAGPAPPRGPPPGSASMASSSDRGLLAAVGQQHYPFGY